LNIKRIALPLFLVLFFPVSNSAQRPAEPLRPNWCGALPRPEYKTLQRVDVHSDWFEVYRIEPAVYAIYEPHQFEEVISYLIVGKRHALLFDTGLGVASIRKVVTRLTKLPVTVLNSHTHFDHTGGNAEFPDIWNEDTPFSRASAQTHSTIYSRDALAPERICGILPQGVRSGDYIKRTWQVTHWIHDREKIDLGGRQLEVLFTPGHTPDSLSLLDRQHGLLFTGDTFYPGPIYLFTPETDFGAYGRSVARLAQLVPHLRLLPPSHNVPVAAPPVLTRLNEAVKKVKSGDAKFEVTDGHRQYFLEGFSLLLSEK
jgi:glyoxylase-like metal-dependent hydrolase (beta-lactamase superfamily II)